MTEPSMTPPLNDETQENKLVALAFKQAQSQLEEQTASSQMVTHFLRLGSQKAKIELKKLELENKLLEEKILAERSGMELNNMLGEVLAALKSYSYRPPGEHDVDVF
jgi:DNA polymerase III delta prime subunit